jgi:hypothetical protein
MIDYSSFLKGFQKKCLIAKINVTNLIFWIRMGMSVNFNSMCCLMKIYIIHFEQKTIHFQEENLN